MENLKHFFRIYIAPRSAMSELLDHGRILFGVGAVLVVAFLFYATVMVKLDTEYRIPQLNEYLETSYFETDNPQQAEAAYYRATADHKAALMNRKSIPIFGDRLYWFFSFDPYKFYMPLILLSIFYVPASIILMSVFGGVGSMGLVMRRDYGSLSVCVLHSWAAAHLPFAIAGIVLYWMPVDPGIYLGMWAASGLLFGVLAVFAMRTVFGANYGVSILIVCLAWMALSAGMQLSTVISPWIFSPLLFIYAFMYFGGAIGGEVSGVGNAFRQKQNLKRFLHNAIINPHDADAHVQLGLIYLQRRQESKALEHFKKAIEIDKTEIDANYELGKLARSKGDEQLALEHFTVVVEQDDKHSLSEIWREIAATYLAGDRLPEARNAIEKYVERRSGDAEGLYYYGKILKAQGENDKASEAFSEAVDAAKSSPDYKRRSTRQWEKLALKEL